MKKSNLIRDRASGISLVFLALCAFIIICLIFILINQTKNLEAWQDIEHISHKALLQMEEDGCLTSENQNSIIRELEDLGVRNINFSDSTYEITEYGETIYLNILGEITMFSNPFKNGEMYKTQQFSIKKQITSKALEGLE